MHFSKVILTTLAMSVSSGLCAPILQRDGLVGRQAAAPGLGGAKDHAALVEATVNTLAKQMSNFSLL